MALIDVSEACRILQAGQLVAIPTETVYGLAADASQLAAVTRVFERKGRPPDHPLIVHLAQPDWAEQWGQLSPLFWLLAERFWPGPLTLVVAKQPWVSPAITGGQATVALRVPRHPLTLDLLTRLGRAVVAPSANRFGRTSPTSSAHVVAEFGSELPVLDGGDCPVGIESTIVDLSHGGARLLRPGQICRNQLQPWLDQQERETSSLPRVPGSLDRHYAPSTRTCLEGECCSKRWGWLGFEDRPEAAYQIVLPCQPEAYARSLYGALRQLDEQGLDLLVVQPPPQSSDWEAIWDRLRRACR